MRRVLLGGLIGALPGLLIVLLPVLLHSLDAITSDQTQIGFIGVPLIVFGVLIGTFVGASGSAHPGRVMFGVVLGFALGLAGGIAIHSAVQATGVAVAGIWLFLTPAAMIAGGAVGARSSEHTTRPHVPASQH